MSDSEKLDEAIAARFLAPLGRVATKSVGIELELPVWNRRGGATDFEAVHAATDEFLRIFPFTETVRDDNGALYRAGDPKTGDELSFDCSFNTLEFSFGPEEDIGRVEERFSRYYPVLQSALEHRGHALTGMGINPRWRENRIEPIANGRYRMLLHHLKSYSKYGGAQRFHGHPDFGLFSCSSQVQLDVDSGTVTRVINAFNALEPFKAILFSNSPFEEGRTLCGRDGLWCRSLHGYNPHNCGLYDVELRSIEDLVGYLKSTSVYCVERGDRYLNFAPVPLRDYLGLGTINAEYWDPDREAYAPYSLVPDAGDVAWLRPFKFEDLTQRGTVEFRSVCAQPIRDAFAPAAFHAGLAANLSVLEEFLKEDHSLYGHGYGPSELRALTVRSSWPTFVDHDALSARLSTLLDIAAAGLRRRGSGEERFLAPLRRRAETLVNPARAHLERLVRGEPIESIAEDYGDMGEGVRSAEVK